MSFVKTFVISHKNQRLIRFLIDINSKISFKPYTTCLVFLKRSLDDEIPYYEPKIKHIKIVNIDKNTNNTLFTKKILEQIERDNESNFTKKAILQKLNKGGVIFVGLTQENDIVHHTWVEKGDITVHDIYLKYTLPKETAYFASSFTPQKYRRLGIGKYVRHHILRFCRDKHFNTATVNVKSDNYASIRVAEAMGFKEYQRVFFYRFLGFKLYKILDSENKRVVYKFGKAQGIWSCFYNNKSKINMLSEIKIRKKNLLKINYRGKTHA